jgi:Protein of unknown function (DUF1203)
MQTESRLRGGSLFLVTRHHGASVSSEHQRDADIKGIRISEGYSSHANQKSGVAPRHPAPCVAQSTGANIMQHFRIKGLPAEPFAPLFDMPDWALEKHGAVRRIADGPRPCRISLTDAKPGDELILVNYEHHAVASPYRMRFAIYVRRGEETFDAVDEVPEQLRTRTLAVRGFDAGGVMTGWELIEGGKLEEAIERQFADPRASYLHVHFAAPGCYAARIERA